MTKFKVVYITLIISMFLLGKVNAQEQKHIVRLAKIEIDSAKLDSYKALLKEGIEAAIKLEKGVLTLYAVFEIQKPNHVTILEIYADKKAYEKHIQTAHFKKYKEATKDMVLKLELVDTNPLLPNLKIK